MVAQGLCPDKLTRYNDFKRIMMQLISDKERRIPFVNKEHEMELIIQARGARKHYLGCFPDYRGEEGFGRFGDPRKPIPLTKMEAEIIGPDAIMLPEWERNENANINNAKSRRHRTRKQRRHIRNSRNSRRR
jgi:hypothetical protein